MADFNVLFLLCTLAASLSPQPVLAEKQMVCTITVNSADEQETFRRYLPAAKYQFVELVERHRPDWLASACRAAIACDVLVISGHYGAGNEFFAEALEASEFLSIGELERVSCSDSCPGLFSRLKEVYLFGCNTLNPHAQHTASGETARSFVREGRSPAQADRLMRLLNSGHGESSRDRMRLVFKDVPVIYGFSSSAPIGPVAGSTLSRYFRATREGEVGNGRASSRLLAHFAAHGMVVTRGMTDADPHADMRQDVCQFADDRLSDAQRLAFIHQVLRRPTAEARMLLGRIEGYMATLDHSDRQQLEVAQALERIARDTGIRERFLAFARDADQPEVRARMVNLAHNLGWLSPDERRKELVRMLSELLARDAIVGTDVALACTLNKEHALDGARHIFRNVPVLYGFSSKAPLGRSARPLLDRYFQSAPLGEIGGGRVSAKLLDLFGPSSMTVAAGLTDADPQARLRSDVCHFVDDRLSGAQKVGFMHELLRRDMAEVRMFLHHIERYSASIEPAQRFAPKAAAALMRSPATEPRASDTSNLCATPTTRRFVPE